MVIYKCETKFFGFFGILILFMAGSLKDMILIRQILIVTSILDDISVADLLDTESQFEL